MLTFAYTLSILLMIFLPVLFAAGWRRMRPTPWLLFSLGTLTFILSQAVHLPLNHWLTTINFLPTPADTTFPLWRSALTLGLTAGLCEELARAGGYALLQRWKPTWLRFQDGVMLGLGHGGFEAIVFGGILTAASISALLPLIGTDLTTLGLSPAQIATLQLQLNSLTAAPWNAGLPLLERLIAMTGHVVFSLLVWQAFARNQVRRDWFWILIAVLYHALLDFVAVIGVTKMQGQALLLELVFAGVVLPGAGWAVWRVRRERVPRPQADLRGEWRVFGIVTMKEFRQLWRTNRLLVMGAVFLLFGMGSPLLAKLTPELLHSLPGAEQIANLIPEPTAGDAMAQYLKNLSQFGFLLAILLVMGTVVGEKERGVVPMILSKPMPRWAFILSKFTAQAGMYLGGFALAGLGAYYYTVILFGALDFGGFALLNGLLFLWLMTFVALGLLGSVLGRSTVAAGGIGLGFAVIMMLLGSLPQYGALFPGGLMAWAAQVGAQAAGAPASALSGGLGSGAAVGMVTAQGGAAASSVALILLMLILAIGVFEQQEL
ncbi:MAG: YhfC family intramembrane metalloprotease [Anaerolineales bacterium]|nr:YhfC family intramembrane metalloprotease [Anaerolineales bacterium]